MNLQSIDQAQFHQLDISRQIIIHEYPHKFTLIDLGEKLGIYGINWNSEFSKPFCKLSLDNQTIWLGVEQKLVAICCSTGHVLLALPLTAYLIQLITLKQVTAALTEQEIFLFNPKGSILYNKALPDLAIGMYAKENLLVIQLSEGEKLVLNLETVI